MQINKLELSKGAKDLLDVIGGELKVERPNVESVVRNLRADVSVAVESIVHRSNLLSKHLSSSKRGKRSRTTCDDEGKDMISSVGDKIQRNE